MNFKGHAELPVFQELKAMSGALSTKTIDFAHALTGGYANAHEYCVVSHRWFFRSRPDDGTQLMAIREFLHEHDSIQYVWFEYENACVVSNSALVHTRRARRTRVGQLQRPGPHHALGPRHVPRANQSVVACLCSYWCMPQALLSRKKTLAEKAHFVSAEAPALAFQPWNSRASSTCCLPCAAACML